MTDTMRAVVLDAPGPPEALTIGPCPRCSRRRHRRRMIDDGNVPSRRTLSAEVDHTPQTMRRSLLSLVLSVAVLPVGWPHHLALGLRESPGEANRIAHSAPLDLRSQYLAGGVNTGAGRASWNPNGSLHRCT
jgi:hypothetical protein